IAAGFGHSVALKNNGTVVAWGYNFGGETAVPVGLSGVTTIASGAYHTLAIVVGPTVTTTSAANTFTLSWPDTATGFRVESALSLFPPVSWSTESGTFQTNGGFISLGLPMSGTQKFYRLTKP
ncbi:MAG: hypothetical protein HY300_04590, partial [Verrucomicrobia bacterium]|nr:hypothetical protein [Verrucomicrobiota bacterium]